MEIETIYDALREVKSNPMSFATLPEEYKSEYIVQKAAVIADGANLEFCSEDLKANRRFVEMAVQSNPDAINFAASHIRDEMLMSKGTLYFTIDPNTKEQAINIKWVTPDNREQNFSFNADNMKDFYTGDYYNENIPASNIKEFIDIVTEQVNGLEGSPQKDFLKDVCEILNEVIREPDRTYYLPDYDINGTADALFEEASGYSDTCSVEKLEMIAKILNEEAVQSGNESYSDKAILIQAIADLSKVDVTTLDFPALNIAQMKVDLLKYDNIYDIDDIAFNEKGNLHLTVQYQPESVNNEKNGDVILHFRGEIEDRTKITTLESTASFSRDRFMEMSQKDFDSAIGELINISHEVEVTKKKNDREKDIDR